MRPVDWCFMKRGHNSRTGAARSPPSVRPVRHDPPMPEVVLDGRAVPYLLVRNPRSRHVRMSLTPDGLRVSAPTRLPQTEVERAVASKERWLRRHADMLVPFTPAALTDGMALPFLDGTVELGVRTAGRASVSFRPEDGRITVAVPPSHDVGAEVRTLVERGYRAVAREWCTWACDHFGAQVGATPASIAVRDPRTRWGSCSARGAVSLSWRLMMAPARVAEYVVVHELAHLVHLDHSADFWGLVARVLPDHRADSAWLREHGGWLWRSPGAGHRPAPPLSGAPT